MRARATVYTSIWEDEDFLQRSPEAQRLYLFLLSQKKLSHVGLLPYQPTVWARKALGLTEAKVARSFAELVETHFILFDPDHGECVIRTLVRHDMATTWQTTTALWKAWTEIASPTLKRAVLSEIPGEHWNATRTVGRDDNARSIPIPVPPEAVAMRSEREEPQVSDCQSDTQSDALSDTQSEGVSDALHEYSGAQVLTSSCAHSAQVLMRSDVGPAPPGPTPDSVLDAVWQTWPSSRREDRKRCLTLVAKALRAGTTAEQLTDGAARWARHYADAGTSDEHIPWLATWLNKERWTTDTPQIRRPPPPGPQMSKGAQVLLAAKQRYAQPTSDLEAIGDGR